MMMVPHTKPEKLVSFSCKDDRTIFVVGIIIWKESDIKQLLKNFMRKRTLKNIIKKSLGN